ncbi:MAG: hypothetical protein GX153_04310 [Clostridiaceae bacterium]|nr:hypothetical protein [Clostridiaceae bacterium]
MDMKHIARTIGILVAVTVVTFAGVRPVSASETATGTGLVECQVPVEGEILPLTLSVTHPVAVSWSIDPNSDTPFAAPDFFVENNSKVRIRTTVKSLAAVTAPVLSDPSEILLLDAAPAAMDWTSLNAEDSMRYIALGVFAREASGWDAGAHQTPAYAVEIDDTLLGSLAAGGSGSVGLTACHGLAISQSFCAAHTLVFTFSID